MASANRAHNLNFLKKYFFIFSGNYTQYIPTYSNYAPQNYAYAPQYANGVPQSYAPQYASGIPQTYANIPQTYTNIPQSYYTNAPQNVASMPQAYVSNPRVETVPVYLYPTKQQNLPAYASIQTLPAYTGVQNIKAPLQQYTYTVPVQTQQVPTQQFTYSVAAAQPKQATVQTVQKYVPVPQAPVTPDQTYAVQPLAVQGYQQMAYGAGYDLCGQSPCPTPQRISIAPVPVPHEIKICDSPMFKSNPYCCN